MDTQLLEAATTDYTNLCTTHSTCPVEWENECLSAGYLPNFAKAVLVARDNATPEYFGWLADQLDEAMLSQQTDLAYER